MPVGLTEVVQTRVFSKEFKDHLHSRLARCPDRGHTAEENDPDGLVNSLLSPTPSALRGGFVTGPGMCFSNGLSVMLPPAWGPVSENHWGEG